MKDSERARMLLRHREKGFSILRAIRGAIRRYILSLVILATLIVFVVLHPQIRLLWIGIGMYAGMFLRDLGWYGAVKRTWAFTERTVDWDRVQEIAGSEGGGPGE